MPAFGRVWTLSVTNEPGRKQVGFRWASTGTSEEGVQGNATGLGPVFCAAGVPLVEVERVEPLVDEDFPDVEPVVEADDDALGDGLTLGGDAPTPRGFAG